MGRLRLDSSRGRVEMALRSPEARSLQGRSCRELPGEWATCFNRWFPMQCSAEES